MLVQFSSFSLQSILQPLLDSLTHDDTIVCCGEGVYGYKALKAAYPQLPILAMQNDCEDRGVSVDNTLTADELCKLHQHHQQWIKL